MTEAENVGPFRLQIVHSANEQREFPPLGKVMCALIKKSAR